ncbi:VOC family protein [Falsiroseomonas selenitidurans]|nr:VOC family protein [Falsiroseomonas selenitidurans]
MAGGALMLDHVSIAIGALDRAAPFYDAVMPPLGMACVWRAEDAIGYGSREAAGYLTIRAGAAPAGPGCHWAFRAPDRAAVRAFHAAGLAAGGEDDGPPGLRPHYHAHYYAAFLRDPSGNRIEAVCHEAPP